MKIADAALVFVTESAAFPRLEQLARSVHEELSWNQPVRTPSAPIRPRRPA